MMLWLSVSVIFKKNKAAFDTQKGANIGLKCARMRLAARLRPDPLGELQRSPRPPSRNWGEGCLLLRGREGKEWEKEKEGDGKREGRMGRGEEGRGREGGLAMYAHTHPFNGPLSRTTRVSRYQKGKTNLDFTEARYSGWQWHQLGHMQVCTSLQTDNHASIPPLSFYRSGALPAAQPTASKH